MTGNLDDIFAQEFAQMMRALRANGTPSLLELPMSPELASRCTVSNYEKVVIKNINDEYYGKLNNTIGLLWTRPDLKRRKFDSEGKYIKKNGAYVTEDVTLPHNCVAIVSERPIGLKTKYKPKEDFIYVDMITQKTEHGKKLKYVYIIPRKYCFRVHQTALAISWNKLTRKLYKGVDISTKWGAHLFMEIIDYRNTMAQKNFRVLSTGTNPDDLESLANDIIQYWVKEGVVFNPADCNIFGEKTPIQNLALNPIDGTIDSYSFCSEYALDNETNIDYSFEDIDEDEEEI